MDEDENPYKAAQTYVEVPRWHCAACKQRELAAFILGLGWGLAVAAEIIVVRIFLGAER